MGNGIIDKLRQEYDIEVIHNGFEIHPDVPEEGMLLKDYFPNAGQMFSQLKMFAGSYGLEVSEVTTMPNTNKMLQLGEYAKDVGKSEAFEKIVFKAVFVEDRNISTMDEIISLCEKAGITKEEVDSVLSSDKYKEKLEDNKRFCRENNITSVPTFIINDQVAIVGAQGPDSFKKAFSQVK
ncbi:hypothetical protein EZV73_03990 [Acidaminobacter sp. JC074]|uniref:DsbA family oxidoreductase n=1 Tax=Acidaminobacter sp. JC074 TaxID=2530199 RepID=UPI00216FC120|nr:hypothetical protein [Acidaminobacter sp. JC074]